MKTYNVDIYWTFHRSIQVEAESELDAKNIVDNMMQDRELERDTFEPDDDDWELDTSYQPDDL